MFDDEFGDMPDLGQCCCCGGIENVRNVLMLHLKAKTPGAGCWGCFQCGLPNEGAVAVVCDRCLNERREILYAVDGEARLNKRVPLSELTEPFEHDMNKHRDGDSWRFI